MRLGIRHGAGSISCADIGNLPGHIGKVKRAFAKMCRALGNVTRALGKVQCALANVRRALGKVRGQLANVTRQHGIVPAHFANRAAPIADLNTRFSRQPVARPSGIAIPEMSSRAYAKPCHLPSLAGQRSGEQLVWTHPDNKKPQPVSVGV